MKKEFARKNAPEDMTLKLAKKTQTTCEVEISFRTLGDLQALFRHLESVDIKPAYLSEENLSDLLAVLPESKESFEGTIHTAMSADNIFHLCRLVTLFYKERNRLPQALSADTVEHLKVFTDSLLHEVQGNQLTFEEQHMIRTLIDTHRYALEELHKR